MIAHSNVSHNQRVYSRTQVPVFSRDSLPPFCRAEQLRSAEAGTIDAYLPNRGDQGGSSPFVFTIEVGKKQETCGKIVIDIVMLYDIIAIPNGNQERLGLCLWSLHSLRTGTSPFLATVNHRRNGACSSLSRLYIPCKNRCFSCVHDSYGAFLLQYRSAVLRNGGMS